MLQNEQVLTSLASSSDSSLPVKGLNGRISCLAGVNRLKFLGHEEVHLNGPHF